MSASPPLSIAASNATRQFVLNSGKDVLSAAIKNLCKTNFLVFMKVELGLEIGDHHKEWWELLKNGDDIIIMSPRDHGKSHALARGYPIWRAKYDPWIKEIYVLGADQPSAVENLDKIKNLMLSKPSLSYLVPETRSEGINSRTELYLKNGVQIKAKGFASPLRGRHPQLIILDDVLNEKNTGNAESRDRMKNYFWTAVMPMKDQGTESKRKKGYKPQVVVIGTAQDQEDLYHELLQPGKGFKGKKQKAIVDEDNKVVLWPERYSYQDLMNIRSIRGSVYFSKEYQNDPLSDDTSVFPPSLFEALKDPDLQYVQHYSGPNPVFLGADFSVPGTMDGDYTVIFVFELDQASNEIIPLNYWRQQPGNIQDQLVQIEYMSRAYNVTMGYMEANMFQRIYSEHFKNNSILPLQGHVVTNVGKLALGTGLLSFRPLFENGRVRFPYKTDRDKIMTDQIIKEFNGVTKKKGKIGNMKYHDDTVIAFWHALCASRNNISFQYEVM